MAGDNSAGSGHTYGEAQGMKVLRASLLTQEMTLRGLADSMKRKFQAFERCFNEIVDRLDMLWP